ncbi:MAG: M23 family metallopeptidase [Candidatus Lernaella stagnicola]|nr:M23 family metallopeptidase [Candidatus Lernaella stagnicola]
MAHRRSKFFTLLVLDDRGRVRRWRLSRRTWQGMVLGAAAVAVLIVALLFVVVHDRFRLAGLDRELRGSQSEPEVVAAAPVSPPPSEELLAAARAQRASLEPAERFFVAVVGDAYDAPHRWPLRGWVTSEFGRRLNSDTDAVEMHQGIDIAAPIGSDVRAPAAGQVLIAEERAGFGLVVVLGHGRGWTTYFGHLDRSLVVPGQQVEAGEVIARSGNTGISRGPHLHYEVRRFGIPLDPRVSLPGYGQAPRAVDS